MSMDPTGVPSEKPHLDDAPGGVPGAGEFALAIASLLASARGPAETAEAFVDRLSHLLSVRAWLLDWDAERGQAGWFIEGDGEPIPLASIGGERSLIRSVLEEGRARRIEPIDADASWPEARYLKRSGGSWAFIPLTVTAQAVGCLILRASDPETLADATLEALEAALPSLSVALRAGRLQRELETRVDDRTAEISLLFDIGNALSNAVRIDELFDLVGSSLHRAVPYDLYALTLLVAGRRDMSIEARVPVDESAIRKVSRAALAEVRRLTGARPGRLPVSVQRRNGPTAEPIGAGGLKSITHVPLQIRGEIAGLITLATGAESPPAESRMRLIFTIANQASLTLDRLRTVHEAEATRIHSMLESMAEGVLLLDGNLRIVMSNPAAQSYLSAILGGAPPRSLVRLGDVRLRPLLSSLGTRGVRSQSFEVVSPFEARLFSVTCSSVRGLGEAPQGLVVVISDVTESRNLQIQVAQSEKLSALGEMISGVAHELNNPLASVMAFAQLLQSRDVDEDVRTKLKAIDTEATRCRKIVQNLLRFARHHTPEHSALSINAAIESVLQLLGHQLEVDDIRVTADLQADLRPVVGDFHLLQQVFLNIIYNAYQAMKERGGPGNLSVVTRGEAGRLVVEITDDGPGIAPQNLGRIFDPFFSTKEVGKGTGLGLSLAYGTVREHGGTISARSVHGAGSTFVVDLPAAPPGVEIDPVPMPALMETPAIRKEGGAEGARRILVIEDEEPLAEVIAEVLQAEGHHVDIAGDGLTARARIAAVRYDLIISDLKMPNMNGREFYRHVASIDGGLAKRIVFSTGDTANPDTQAFFEEVGNPFLSKPFNLADLIRVVDSVLLERQEHGPAGPGVIDSGP